MGWVPGGYIFTHLIFWGVVALVAVGTNAVAIMLVTGLALLLLPRVAQTLSTPGRRR